MESRPSISSDAELGASSPADPPAATRTDRQYAPVASVAPPSGSSELSASELSASDPEALTAGASIAGEGRGVAGFFSALQRRAEVAQATGVVLATWQVTVQEAEALLVAEACRRGVTVVDVARVVVAEPSSAVSLRPAPAAGVLPAQADAEGS